MDMRQLLKKKPLLLIIITCVNFLIYSNQPHLLIKIPTRSRPVQFFKILDVYYKYLSNTIPYSFLISCDLDDKSMNNSDVINKLKKYPNLFYYFGKSSTKIEAYNRDMDKHLNFDILLVTSDDAVPSMKGYDKIIVDLMVKNFPDFDGVINFNDGYVKRVTNTLPIIGKKFYDRFNYIYYPKYKSVCCDHELTLVSRILGKECYSDTTIIKHNHPIYDQKVKYDQLYQRNDKWFDYDVKIYNTRHENNFYLDSMLKSDFKLSILICTLEVRINAFDKIYSKLQNQIKENKLQNNVEILYFKDDKNHSIGHKRNELLRRSKGEYVCFVDDDDDIHDDYINIICKAIENKTDCISLNGIITIDGENPKNFIHSIKYNRWYEENNVYFRPPNHLNPIKRVIAAQFVFPDINFGEDKAWSMDLVKSGLLKTESVIDKPYYFYKFITKK